MSLRSITLLLAVAGGATYLYRRRHSGSGPTLALPAPVGTSGLPDRDDMARDTGMAGGAAYATGGAAVGTLGAGDLTSERLAGDDAGPGLSLPEGGDRSLNRVEMLQDEDLLGSPMTADGDLTGGRGDVAPDIARETEGVFGSSSQKREGPVGAGLPDLTRGA